MPHANFSCKLCGIDAGGLEPVVHEDLPVQSKFCPVCGDAEGFTRLFDAVNVIGGKGRTLQKVLDENLGPLYEKDAKQKSGAAAFAKAGQEALEKTYEKATPAERAKLPTTFQPHLAPAGQVLGTMTADARRDTRECVTPALLNRQVRPQWQK